MVIYNNQTILLEKVLNKLKKKICEVFLTFFKASNRIYVTSERMVGISSVLPFWNPQSVSSNLGYSDLLIKHKRVIGD